MRARGLLRKVLDQGEVIGHRMRVEALLNAVDVLALGANLSLTCLGRALRSNAMEKHRIKSIDELLRNRHLQAECLGIYRELAHRVLCGVSRVLVQVDWSDTGRRDVRVLRAAVGLRGRSFVLLEKVYTEKQYNKASTHRAFVRELHQVMPPWCEHVLVVSDAGFRAPWFRLIESFGWRWLSRVRNCSKVQRAGQEKWRTVQELYASATRRAQKLGPVLLNVGSPLRAQMFLSPIPKPKRRGLRRNAEHYRMAKSHREPWLLATSANWVCTAQQAIELYETRMQIEQGFRDLKSHRFGYGLRYSNSKKPERVAILLLIAALATFAQWLVGLVAEAQDWSRTFQANTERKRRTLSIVTIGARVLRTHRYKLTEALLWRALKNLPKLVVQPHAVA